MPLNQRTTRTFHRTLYATELKSIVVLKRNVDQGQGTVTKYNLFQCRRSFISKTGEAIYDDETSQHSCIWHIPRIEMQRVGLTDINSADRIIENTDYAPTTTKQRWWQPESTVGVDIKLFENQLRVQCLRIDPPNVATNPLPIL